MEQGGAGSRHREPRTVFGMYVADARSVQSPEKAASSKDHDLIESHLFYVIQVAREYRNLGIPIEDLMSEGNLGLMEAARRFDRTRGVKFISYATWWIRKRIWELVIRQVSLVRIPKYRMERLRRVRTVERDLRASLGRSPLTEEVAQAAGLSQAEVETLRSQAQREISFDTVINVDSGMKLEEIVAENGSSRPDAAYLDENAVTALATYLDHLSARQRVILSMHFGLGDKKSHTLAEIGKELGVSRERVRQLERQGLTRLRRLMAIDGHCAVAS